MKLLLDENLSDKIIDRISDLFPDCTHVRKVALIQADDTAIVDWAREHGFSIVSKDTDFYQRAVALGPPLKFIWLRIGNCRTETIVHLLRSRHTLIRDFTGSRTESVLVLERAS